MFGARGFSVYFKVVHVILLSFKRIMDYNGAELWFHVLCFIRSSPSNNQRKS